MRVSTFLVVVCAGRGAGCAGRPRKHARKRTNRKRYQPTPKLGEPLSCTISRYCMYTPSWTHHENAEDEIAEANVLASPKRGKGWVPAPLQRLTSGDKLALVASVSVVGRFKLLVLGCTCCFAVGSLGWRAT